MSAEIIFQDLGGWISGPCADIEPVAAEQVQPGDRLLLETGQPAEITDVRHSMFWLNTGSYSPASRSAGDRAARPASGSARPATSCSASRASRRRPGPAGTEVSSLAGPARD